MQLEILISGIPLGEILVDIENRLAVLEAKQTPAFGQETKQKEKSDEIHQPSKA
jgi:hypothetical protein